MFKWLFYYWFNPTDTPSIMSRINLWAYINIRVFKIKILNIITYFILGLNNLAIKKIKIFYKNISFKIFYFNIFYFILIFFILLNLLLLF